MMKRMGIEIDKTKVKLDNVAGVMVTATLPPFAKVGTRIDVVVSSMGNATDLQGGTLLLTPSECTRWTRVRSCSGAHFHWWFYCGRVMQVEVFKKITLRLPIYREGAIVEKNVQLNLLEDEAISLNLNSPDFTSCLRLTRVINQGLGRRTCTAH